MKKTNEWIFKKIIGKDELITMKAIGSAILGEEVLERVKIILTDRNIYFVKHKGGFRKEVIRINLFSLKRVWNERLEVVLQMEDYEEYRLFVPNHKRWLFQFDLFFHTYIHLQKQSGLIY